ncbi:MAG: alpha-galactosidase [Ruminococcaceae bacterium]|nr:alpha-galactosidase [Oscillospiraceae bacterium]
MHQHDFREVFYQPGEKPVFCYRSGLAVYEEQFSGGVLCGAGYNAAGYPLNVLSNVTTRLNPHEFWEPSAFNIELDGVSVDQHLRFIDFSQAEEGRSVHAVITLESDLKPVRIRVHTLLDGTQMFSRWLEIENLSDKPMSLSRLAVLAGGLETLNRDCYTNDNSPEKLYSIGYFNSVIWGREGAFAWHNLPCASTVIDTRFNRERYRHPLVFIRSNLSGVIWFSQIAWSGGCRFTADLDDSGHVLTTANHHGKLSFKAEITGYNPMLVLRPGKCFTSPEVHMGVVASGFDDAVNEMHAHIRRSVLTMPEADGSACIIGAGMGPEHDMSVETSKAFIRQFAEMGAEIFIIDAGWFCPPAKERMGWSTYNGINRPNPERYPNGIAELSDYCHELGLKFAMWTEMERMGEESGMIAAHPDWYACNKFGDCIKGFLDFTNPEAAQWAEDELARIIEEYKLDLLRVDYNTASPQYYGFRDLGTGIPEGLTLRHFNAVYKMYQNLKRRFPNVIFENCAGGGGRTDLGQMKAFNHTWVSDWQKAPHSIMITNGMTMALPPERVDRLFAGMGCHEFGAFDAHMRNTMLGHMSLNVVAPTAARPNPVQMEFVRHSVGIYKNFIRPFLAESLIYHHTPEAASDPTAPYTAIELTAPAKDRGVLAVFTMSASAHDRITIYPRGIDAGRDYEVTFDNSRSKRVISGYELISQGVTVTIPSSLSSELVLFQAV